jgi:diguanylate cyclase (GGDEF)-like protein
LNSSLEREKELSRTDYLTGASNSRYFYEVMQVEINRHRRYKHPFTLAYIDVDNLKLVNDKYGHFEGDQTLKNLVSSVKKLTRNTDMIARLGGDEFALFFPETDQKEASIITKNLFIDNVLGKSKPVTYSIGVVTFRVPPSSIDELIKITDKLMYTAKSGGKNTIKYFVYEG